LKGINKFLQYDEAQVLDGHSCEKPGLVPSIESWLGRVYVMHGANLGRKVIKKHVTKCFGNSGLSGNLSFFEESPSEPQWHSVISRLDHKITEIGSIEESSEAALAVFKWLVLRGQSS
jgi:heme oxygenase